MSRSVSIVSNTTTTYPADAIEFWPSDSKSFVTATYQNNGTESASRKREGTIEVYEIKNHELILKQKVEDLPAVLDLKWRPSKSPHTESLLLGAAGSEGAILFYDALDNQLQFKSSIQIASKDVLCLSMDWARTRNPPLIASLSDGNIACLEPAESSYRISESWKTHDFEPWIVAWDYWQEGYFWTGGDDCCLKAWDIRQGNTPVWVNRKFDAGVTSVRSHQVQENIFAVGSYDSQLRIFDKRRPFTPLSSLDVGGGVWRVKWHPTSPALLSAACMHDGFKVIRFNPSESWQGQITAEWKHESMAYGVDWSGSGGLLTGCSFYDKKVTVIQVDLATDT
ncbi:WD40 repeat-like protein [Atractiella rhizophila]|nr:WD40 repeat-like protein [Atractiella rhizophila]